MGASNARAVTRRTSCRERKNARAVPAARGRGSANARSVSRYEPARADVPRRLAIDDFLAYLAQFAARGTRRPGWNQSNAAKTCSIQAGPQSRRRTCSSSCVKTLRCTSTGAREEVIGHHDGGQAEPERERLADVGHHESGIDRQFGAQLIEHGRRACREPSQPHKGDRSDEQPGQPSQPSDDEDRERDCRPRRRSCDYRPERIRPSAAARSMCQTADAACGTPERPGNALSRGDASASAAAARHTSCRSQGPLWPSTALADHAAAASTSELQAERPDSRRGR